MIKRIGAAKTGTGGQPLPFCRATIANGFVFVSGQVGMTDTGEIVEGGIVPQTHQTFDNLLAILKEAGCSLTDVVKVNVWLDDARDFASFNRIYSHHFGVELPARSCVESRLMVDAKVEVDAIACLPKVR